VKISGDTTVRDFALQNDKIVAALSQTLKAATPTAIKYNKSDGSCAVTLEVKTADIIRTTERFVKKDGATKTTVTDSIETKTFSETGNGVMRPAADPNAPRISGSVTSDSAASAGSNEPFFETKMVLREVVQSGPVVQ